MIKGKKLHEYTFWGGFGMMNWNVMAKECIKRDKSIVRYYHNLLFGINKWKGMKETEGTKEREYVSGEKRVVTIWTYPLPLRKGMG